MKKLLIGLMLVSGVAQAQVISTPFGQAGTLKPIGPMPGEPTLLDLMHQQDLIDFGNDIALKRFAKPWETAGCTVEGMNPMDRIICPGFRIDPKVKPDVSEQWFVSEELPAQVYKPSKWEKKCFLDGQI